MLIYKEITGPFIDQLMEGVGRNILLTPAMEHRIKEKAREILCDRNSLRDVTSPNWIDFKVHTRRGNVSVQPCNTFTLVLMCGEQPPALNSLRYRSHYTGEVYQYNFDSNGNPNISEANPAADYIEMEIRV